MEDERLRKHAISDGSTTFELLYPEAWRRRGRTIGARRAWGGIGREGGILYIFPGQIHMSGLANGGNLTEGGRGGVEDKQV